MGCECTSAYVAVRYNALSRAIESALQKDSVPNRIVGGHKFFERMEIKDLLAYLQLAENPNFSVSTLFRQSRPGCVVWMRE
jgi:DNA helicase-2/ATP-dependent DNA helicase PcrA